ncbi:hypothetical protein HOLleu_25809 [Holothuria leucospilota]|uniref:Uncharacterized protein n=1 Tax=Holothuria leucospilota TaxID=206669 RepID=A0A9Q1BTE2_HOLLE|nr:hypothetical protein HOLleu_25809 [Holothuria leucospilota]
MSYTGLELYKSNNVLLSSKRQGSTYRVIPDNCILNSEIITRPASWLEISGVARFFVIGSTIDDVVIIAQFPSPLRFYFINLRTFRCKMVLSLGCFGTDHVWPENVHNLVNANFWLGKREYVVY